MFRYGPEVIDALAVCWAVLDGPSGKIVRPALPVPGREPGRQGRAERDTRVIDALLAMSAATIDRRLRPYRLGLVGNLKGRSLTRPGSLLKSSIPLKTWHEWDDAQPGVHRDRSGRSRRRRQQRPLPLQPGRCRRGYRLDRNHHREVQGRKDRGHRAGATRPRFPFAIVGVHSDNGSEFINHHLMSWCNTREITFTRGRPNHSNDQAHIEQKNWTRVRRNVGYYRYDTSRELDLLNQLWPLAAELSNLFTPQQKLKTKTRTGAKVTKTYDTATTPVCGCSVTTPPVLDDQDRRHLDSRITRPTRPNYAETSTSSNATCSNSPAAARAILKTTKRNHVYLSRTKMTRAKRNESTTQPKRAS